MSMLKPKPGEKQDDYISRCMGDDAMAKEYPDDKQRAAVAQSMWKEGQKKGFELSDLADSLGGRFSTSRWGIGNALQYVKSVGANGAAIFGVTPDAWTKEMEAAADRLTYCDETSGDTDYITKSIREGTDISTGAVLEYDAMMVTRRKDRDGDILEPAGLDIDTKMPLLAHHVQAAPYGKHVAILKQTDDVWVSRWAIADFPLGRDMAALTRFGAIRKSHGFKPVPGEFEPLEIVKSADGKQRANGWHIKKAGVFEGSGVSIPSNVDGRILTVYEKQFDGICTAFSRDLLETPAMKTWAKSMFDQRPATVRGISLEDMASPKAVTDVETKSVADTLEDYEFPGSFEWIRDNLQRELMTNLYRSNVYIAATFADYAIICRSQYDDNGRKVECYKRTWASNEDGKPKFTGEPVEIEVNPQVIEKMKKVFDDLKTKAASDSDEGSNNDGQVLSTIEDRQKSIGELSRELAAAAIASDDQDEVISALEPIEKALGAVRQQRESNLLEDFLKS